MLISLQAKNQNYTLFSLSRPYKYLRGGGRKHSLYDDDGV